MEVAFRIGPLIIRWYSLLIIAGILLGGYIATLEAKRRGENPDHVSGILVLAIPLALIGGRLYHVISSWSYYSQYPSLIPQAWRGGLGIYGAVAGAILAVAIYTKWKKLSLARWLDIGVAPLILGQAIGRWGNFFNQELYGPPTSLPWGIPIDAVHRLPGYEAYERFHPLFLYEFLWNLAGFALLLFLARCYSSRLKDGDIVLAYGIFYPFGRFFLEFLKLDAWTILGVATAQWISAASVIGCSIALFLRHRSKAKVAPARSPTPGKKRRRK
ncbi:MAG: prolipoprotein diacylglyceryl transferase [Chloroflexi bacterium]|nr:prolipoprotein diacylglyceryl transferase [Chloroflexota bacterium]